MPKVEIINPISYPGWDHLLLSSQHHSFFHSSNWARVLHDSYKYNPLYFTTIDNSNKMSALIPIVQIRSLITGTRGTSLPFSDYSELLANDFLHFHNTFMQIINYARKAGWKYLEVRVHINLPCYIPFFRYYYGHTLELTPNEEEILSRIRHSTKTNIKKAAREGVQVKICNSAESIKEFYRLHCKTRKRHGLPPQPYFFFRKVFDHIISNNQGFVVLASYKKKSIAGAVFFHFGKKAIFKYAASDNRYNHLRPNNLVIWEAIKRYSQNGYSIFCFGRTSPGNKGLLQFKSGWGAKQHTIRYYKYDLRKEAYINGHPKIGTFSRRLFSRVPMPLLKVMGTLLYKHMG